MAPPSSSFPLLMQEPMTTPCRIAEGCRLSHFMISRNAIASNCKSTLPSFMADRLCPQSWEEGLFPFSSTSENKIDFPHSSFSISFHFRFLRSGHLTLASADQSCAANGISISSHLTEEREGFAPLACFFASTHLTKQPFYTAAEMENQTQRVTREK